MSEQFPLSEFDSIKRVYSSYYRDVIHHEFMMRSVALTASKALPHELPHGYE